MLWQESGGSLQDEQSVSDHSAIMVSSILERKESTALMTILKELINHNGLFARMTGMDWIVLFWLRSKKFSKEP